MSSTKKSELAFALLCILPLSACTIFGMHGSKTEAVSLFDGKSLDGWIASSENPDSFQVEDGAIVAHGPRAHLFYDGSLGTDFDNFVLRLQVKTEKGSNSGVFFHTRYQAEGWPRKGLEAQINATHSDVIKSGSLYAIANLRVDTEQSFASNQGVDAGSSKKWLALPHRDEEWFDYKIVVQNETVKTFIDGDLIIEWQQPADWPNTDQRLSSGTFALQAHDPNSKVSFRSIRVTRLPSAQGH